MTDDDRLDGSHRVALEDVPGDVRESVGTLSSLVRRESPAAIEALALLDGERVVHLRDGPTEETGTLDAVARRMCRGLDDPPETPPAGPDCVVWDYRDVVTVLVAVDDRYRFFFALDGGFEMGPKVGYLVEECSRALGRE